MCGPQFGTYIVHTEHMDVRYPSNVDDKDISSERTYEQPFLGPPTEMTYSIAKNRLCSMVRELTDTANKSGVEIDELDYGTTLSFDKKFTDLYDELPYYLRYDDFSYGKSQAVFKERPYIEWQRHYLLFSLHTRIARLHRPFLVRGYKDHRYEYSRRVCLQSTRFVIGTEKGLPRILCGRLWPVGYHFFVACVTLVMEYCCHRDQPQAPSLKKEILNCYQILEEKEKEDPGMRQGLACLKQITSEWRMRRGDPKVYNNRRLLPESQLTAEQPPVSRSINTESTTAQLYVPWTTGNVRTEYTTWPEATSWMGLGTAPELWMDQAGPEKESDVQWEALFRELDGQQIAWGF